MIETITSLVFQITIFFLIALLMNTLINWRLKKISPLIDLSQLSILILKGATFISFALLLTELSETFVPLKNVLTIKYSNEDLYQQLFLYLSVFTTIILILQTLSFFLTWLLYSLVSATKGLFIEASRDNHTAVLLFAIIFISFTLFIKAEMVTILDFLIPYPTAATFQ